MYEIHYEAENNILFYRVSGFWTMSILTDFGNDIMREIKKIKVSRENFDVLNDSLDFAIQAPDVAAAIGAMMPVGAKLTTGRKAFVVGSMLGKIQTERTLAHPSMRVFLSLADARAWLASPRDEVL